MVAADKVYLIRIPKLEGEQVQNHLARELSPICSLNRTTREEMSKILDNILALVVAADKVYLIRVPSLRANRCRITSHENCPRSALSTGQEKR